MTNEIENKVVVAENDNKSSSPSTVNALDLLHDFKIVNDFKKSSGSNDSISSLQILDKKSEGAIGKISDKYIDGSLSKEKFEQPLSRTEQLLANGMRDAIRSGSVDQVQDMLKTISENPKSVDRVLRQVSNDLSKSNYLDSATWEQGTSSNGEPFVRLHLNHQDSASKSSGGTEVTIGSDGRNSASYRGSWDSQPKPASPDDSMRNFGGKKYLDNFYNEHSPRDLYQLPYDVEGYIKK